MCKNKIILMVIVSCCILGIGLQLYKINKNPIFEVYVSVDTNVAYFNDPSCYQKSWHATLECLNSQQHCLKITQGYVGGVGQYGENYDELTFYPEKETEVSILSNEEYEKFERCFEYIQKNYKQKAKDKMYDGFYEGTIWFFYIKGKYYSSSSERKNTGEQYIDLMMDEKIRTDLFALINSYMDSPPLVESQ